MDKIIKSLFFVIVLLGGIIFVAADDAHLFTDTSDNPLVIISNSGALNATGDICTTGGNCLSSVGGGSSSWLSGTDTIYNLTAKVGIGTVPSYPVHISNAGADPLLFLERGVNNAGFDFSGNEFNIRTRTNVDMNFYTNNAIKMSLLKTGELGIGTATPTHKLNVVGDTNFTGDLIVEGDYLVMRGENLAVFDSAQGFTESLNWESGDGSGAPFYNLAFNNLSFDGTGGRHFSINYQKTGIDADPTITSDIRMKTTKVLIDGILGIGTITPNAKLEITGNSDDDGFFYTSLLLRDLDTTAGSKGTQIEWQDLNDVSLGAILGTDNLGIQIRNSSGDFTATFSQSGFVGIGTTTPSTELHVVGSTTITGNLQLNGILLDGNGAVTDSGMVRYSDGTNTARDTGTELCSYFGMSCNKQFVRFDGGGVFVLVESTCGSDSGTSFIAWCN